MKYPRIVRLTVLGCETYKLIMYSQVRWDPEGQDDVLLLQSAHLWTRFHNMQITLHRPFIAPRPNTPKEVTTELGFPSLSICLSAARAVIRIIDTVQRRFPGQLFPLLHVNTHRGLPSYAVLS